MAITVLVADDHGVLRDGLCRLLESQDGIQVVGTVADGLQAIDLAEQVQPDIVLMDISMPRLNGIEATRSLAERAPNAGVVILSMHSSPDVIHRALAAGARAFLLKESVSDEVVAAIRAVAAGGRYLGQGISFTGLDPKRSGGLTVPNLEDLTRAEREIVRLVADGSSNAQAAQLLGLSTRTVETYRSRIMEKLQLDSLSALVKFAIRNGLASLD
jgi:two-component system, NarL family, response regulator NreC